jgi:alkylation response protein AidB-like acyl-CoA dehydrogenase
VGSVYRVLWVLAGTSVAGDRCPTLLFILLSKWDFFVYLKKDKTMKNETIISPELQRFMELHKIPNLTLLLQIEDEILLGMVGFGWRMLREVLELREPN